MSASLILVIALSVGLALLAWLALRPLRASHDSDNLADADELERRHVTYFPLIRRALAREDLDFLTSSGRREVLHRVRDERRDIAMAYLASLRHEFLKLWRLAGVVARMSDRVETTQEAKRFALVLGFLLRYEMLRLKFRFGLAPLAQLSALTEIVGRLALRLETAMQELGERAALAPQLASGPERRGLNTP